MNPSRPAAAPLSLVLLAIEGHADELPDELIFEALLYRPEARVRVWRGAGSLAVLRAEDELDSVLWAGQVLDRLREHGLRLSAGVASGRDGREDLLARATATLDRARFHGGAMVLAWSTTAGVQRSRLALGEAGSLRT